MKIKKEETQITGHWLFDGKSMTEDENCKRIEWLRKNYLVLLAIDESGWLKLYQDPEDRRYWELGFPFGEMQGGGAPVLTLLFENEARDRYNF